MVENSAHCAPGLMTTDSGGTSCPVNLLWRAATASRSGGMPTIEV